MRGLYLPSATGSHRTTQRNTRKKRHNKGVIERISAGKIPYCILGGLSEKPSINQTVDHFSKILTLLHAPCIKNGQDHRAELGKSNLPNSFEQFLTSHMATSAVALLLALPGGALQYVSEKKIRFSVKFGIPFDNQVDGGGKIELEHEVFE